MAELYQFNLSDFAGHPSMVGLKGVVNADWGKTATDRLQAEILRKRERRGEAANYLRIPRKRGQR